MGREIRRVPPNWEHPKKRLYVSSDNCFRMVFMPMHDRCFEEESKEWLQGLEEWKNKTHIYYDEGLEYWDCAGNPPDRDYYVPYKKNEGVWYQVYETVSEGTPVSPPFETEHELVEYLVEHGDFWGQKECTHGWNRSRAEKFVKNDLWSPTMTVDLGKFKISTEQEVNDE